MNGAKDLTQPGNAVLAAAAADFSHGVVARLAGLRIGTLATRKSAQERSIIDSVFDETIHFKGGGRPPGGYAVKLGCMTPVESRFQSPRNDTVVNSKDWPRQ
jgi:hypothetical protein